MAEPARQPESEAGGFHGASELEATQRRMARPQNGLKGGGDGDGKAAGDLSAAPRYTTHNYPGREADSERGHAALDKMEAARKEHEAKKASAASQAADSSTRSASSASASPTAEHGLGSQPPPTAAAKSHASTSNTAGGAAPIGGSAGAGLGTKAGGDKDQSNANPGGNLMPSSGGNQGFMKRNRRKFAIGGGLSGFLITIVLGFFALLPLKIEAMVKAVLGDKPNQRLEHAMERRAEKIFIRYAMQNSLAAGGAIVATGNPLGDLYRTWRSQKFETNLADRQKIAITKGERPGSIRIVSLEGTTDFSSIPDLERYLGSDIKGKEARKFIRAAVRSETKWFQVYKRRHLRRWLANAYGIRKWWIIDRKSSDKDAKTDFEKNLATAETEGYENKVAEGLECMVGGTSCPEDNPGDNPGEEPKIDPTADGASAADAVAKSAGEAAGEATSKTFSDILGKKLAAILGSELVPVVGWVDLAARIDDFMWNNKANAVVKDIRKVQYADVFASWAIIADQLHEGDVTAAGVGAAVKSLDNMEKSKAYCVLFLKKPTGCGQDIAGNKRLSNSTLNAITTGYKATNFASHFQLTTYLHTGGKIFDVLGGVVGWLINKIPGVTSLNKFVTGFLIDQIKVIIGPVVASHDDGVVQFNGTRLGNDIATNEFMHYQAGGIKGTAQSLRQTDDTIAADQHSQKLSLADRLWSTDNTNSLVMHLAAAMPSTPGTAISNGFSQAMAVIANPFRLVTGAASWSSDVAAGNTLADEDSAATDEYGVDQYDIPESALDQDVNLEALDQAKANAAAHGRNIDQMVPEDCPDVPEGQVNMCRIDLITIQSLKAVYTNKDDGGLNSSGGQ